VDGGPVAFAADLAADSLMFTQSPAEMKCTKLVARYSSVTGEYRAAGRSRNRRLQFDPLELPAAEQH
jgi:hypothetical protein